MKPLLFLLSLSIFSALATAGLDMEPGVTKESGKVLSRIGQKLILVDSDQKTNRTFEIPASAKIILDGELAKLENIEKGDSVEITLSADKKVTKVDAKSGKVKIGDLPSPLTSAKSNR